MTRILSILLGISLATLATAQDIDRSKAPKPGPAPVINIADPATFTLPNGLKVFVVTNTKLPQVSAVLTIERDPIVEGEKAGVVEMAGSLMRRGTKKMDKATLDEQVDFLGANLSSSATAVSASSLKQHFPSLLDLMADVVLQPAFAEEELEKDRKKMLSGLAQAKDDPNAIVANVSGMLMYGKTHPYGEVATETTVKSVTLADVKKYHSTWWKPNIAYLVMVGDITPAEAQKLATEKFGAWTKGEVPSLKYAAVQPPAKTFIAIVDRPSSVQSVISIGAPLDLRPGAPDAIPASVMASILGGGFSSRLMQNLREKYGFTYGARGGVSTDKLAGRFSASASVRNEKTDSAIGQFLHEFNRLRTEVAPDKEVTAMKNYMSGGFARSLEDPGTIAGFALNVARYNLPKDYYRNYLTRLNAVNAAVVKQMAEKYIPAQHLVITIVGNAKEIAKGLDKYGEVKYFDRDGNPTSAPVVKAVEAGVSAPDILKKAIAAYGGEAGLAAVKDLTLSGTMSFMGQSLNFEQKHVMPDGFSMAVSMGGMAVMTQSKSGDQYKVTMQGQSQPVDDDTRRELDARASVFEERHYLGNGYKLELKGKEQLDGKDAYQVSITSPGGNTSLHWYDATTGLKMQESKEQEMGQMGKVTVTTKITEYKEFSGLKLPVKISIDAGPIQQEIQIIDVKVNSGLTGVN